VVTDTGTMGSHASQVAREFGIPAVVCTGNATGRLRSGPDVLPKSTVHTGVIFGTGERNQVDGHRV
jgi:phosphoenolpyruvate synthase/pyruvate phosphate dikinase